MSLSIQTNSASTAIANNLNTTNKALAVSLERLGTGFRINSAQDDAAGLQIANRLNSQMVGQKTAIKNSNNAISMLQTAEGAFEEMTNIVTRMQELATQSSNGVYNDDDRKALNAEYQELGAELDNILGNTTYGKGTNLLSAGGKLDDKIDFQVGASSSEKMEVDISAELKKIHEAIEGPARKAFNDNKIGEHIETLKTAFDSGDKATVEAARKALGTAVMAFSTAAESAGSLTADEKTAIDKLADDVSKATGKDIADPDKDLFDALEEISGLGIGSVGTEASAGTAIDEMASLIDTLGEARSGLGASINRLGSTINNLSNMAEASEAAFGQIMDADFAEESAQRSKQQLLLQSGVSVLTASNSTSQVISQLLR